MFQLAPIVVPAEVYRTRPQDILESVARSKQIGVLAHLSQISTYAAEIFEGLFGLGNETFDRLQAVNSRIAALEARQDQVDTVFQSVSVNTPVRSDFQQPDMRVLGDMVGAHTRPRVLSQMFKKAHAPPDFSCLNDASEDHTLKYSNPNLFFEAWAESARSRVEKHHRERKHAKKPRHRRQRIQKIRQRVFDADTVTGSEAVPTVPAVSDFPVAVSGPAETAVSDPPERALDMQPCNSAASEDMEHIWNQTFYSSLVSPTPIVSTALPVSLPACTSDPTLKQPFFNPNLPPVTSLPSNIPPPPVGLPQLFGLSVLSPPIDLPPPPVGFLAKLPPAPADPPVFCELPCKPFEKALGTLPPPPVGLPVLSPPPVLPPPSLLSAIPVSPVLSVDNRAVDLSVPAPPTPPTTPITLNLLPPSAPAPVTKPPTTSPLSFLSAIRDRKARALRPVKAEAVKPMTLKEQIINARKTGVLKPTKLRVVNDAPPSRDVDFSLVDRLLELQDFLDPDSNSNSSGEDWEESDDDFE
jgi:hypothetical protein